MRANPTAAIEQKLFDGQRSGTSPVAGSPVSQNHLNVRFLASAAAPVGGKFSVLTKATQLNRGDVVQGAVSISRPVHVTLALKLRNDAQLESFLMRAKQPGTPASQRVMSRSTLAANHLPTAAQAQAVASYLKNAGFTNVKIHSGNMLVSGDASAAIAQSAFQTTDRKSTRLNSSHP